MLSPAGVRTVGIWLRCCKGTQQLHLWVRPHMLRSIWNPGLSREQVVPLYQWPCNILMVEKFLLWWRNLLLVAYAFSSVSLWNHFDSLRLKAVPTLHSYWNVIQMKTTVTSPWIDDYDILPFLSNNICNVLTWSGKNGRLLTAKSSVKNNAMLYQEIMYFAVHYHKYREIQNWQEAVLSSSAAWSGVPNMFSWSTKCSHSNLRMPQAYGGQDRSLKINSSLFIKKEFYTTLVPSKIRN